MEEKGKLNGTNTEEEKKHIEELKKDLVAANKAVNAAEIAELEAKKAKEKELEEERLEEMKTNAREQKDQMDILEVAITKGWAAAWETIKNGLGPIWRGIIGGIMIFLRKIPLIGEKIYKWYIGGNKQASGGVKGVNFSPQKLSIPALAQGAVIPPNSQFMAMLGDQKSGTNIETPLATMVQAFKQAMAESGMNSPNKAVMQVDGITFAQLIYKYNNKEQNRIGINLIERTN